MTKGLTAEEYRDATLALWRVIGFMTADIILHPNGATQIAMRIKQQLDQEADE